MRCDDIERALSDDSGDLKAVARHLETCRECAARFGRDTALEIALRDLTLNSETVDITDELSKKLFHSTLVWLPPIIMTHPASAVV